MSLDDKIEDHEHQNDEDEHREDAAPGHHLRHDSARTDYSSDSEEDDDAITAEEMATRMSGAPIVKLRGKAVDSSSSTSNAHSLNVQSVNRVQGIPPSSLKSDSKVKALPEKYAATAAVVSHIGPSIAPSLPKQIGKQPLAAVKKGVPSAGKNLADSSPILCVPVASAVKKEKSVAAGTSKYRNQIGSLVEMGFDSATALRALEESSGSIEAATNLLLSESGGTVHAVKQASVGGNVIEHQPQVLHLSSLKDAKGKPLKGSYGPAETASIRTTKVEPPKSVPVPQKMAIGGSSYSQKVAALSTSSQPGSNLSMNEMPPPVIPKSHVSATSVNSDLRSPSGYGSGSDYSSNSMNGLTQGSNIQYDTQIQALVGMGFSSAASLNALVKHNGNLKQAASWLLSQELVTDSVNGQPTASPLPFPPQAPILNVGLVHSSWPALQQSQQKPQSLAQNAPPGLQPVGISAAKDPVPRSRGPTSAPPLSSQHQLDTEFGFDYGPLSFAPDNKSLTGTSRLLGMSNTTDHSAPPGLSAPLRGTISSGNCTDFSALMQPPGSGLISQSAPPGMDLPGRLSGATSNEPFMMYGFQDNFSSSLSNGLGSGLGSGLNGRLGDSLGGSFGGSLSSGLTSGMNTGLNGAFGTGLGADLMGSLGGNVASDLSSTANPFSRNRGLPDSSVAPSLPPSSRREAIGGMSGFSDSLFNDNFTEAVANAVIGSPLLSNGNTDSDNRSNINFGFSGLQQIGQPDFYGDSAGASSYASLLGGSSEFETNSIQGSSFSYASALQSPTIATGVSGSIPGYIVQPGASSSGSPTSPTNVLSSASYQKGYKSKACVFYQSPKGCARGDKCTFAHVADNVVPSQSPNKTYYQNVSKR